MKDLDDDLPGIAGGSLPRFPILLSRLVFIVATLRCGLVALEWAVHRLFAAMPGRTAAVAIGVGICREGSASR